MRKFSAKVLKSDARQNHSDRYCRRSVCCLAIIFLWNLSPAAAQVWTDFFATSAPGIETIDAVALAPDGAIAVAGAYNAAFSWRGAALPATEGQDVWLSCMNPDGEVRWAKSGGSILDDEVAAVVADADGNIIVAGSFWLTGTFDGLTLHAGDNPKALFLLKYSPQGLLLWGRSIAGTGIKGLGGLATDPAGNVYAAGFFGGALQLGDSTLQAEGATDVFVTKLSSDGQWNWAFREGKIADTRAVAITWTVENQVLIAGFFNKNTRIAGQEFTANTSDRDAFLAAYAAETGLPRWAAKAGGVFDDDITALAADEQGRIYAVGYLVGVMTLSPNLAIQSATGIPDFFILQYSGDGIPLRARALGGAQTNLATGIAVAGGRVLVGGHYQGAMMWDGISLSNSAVFAGFVAAFDDQLQGLWAQRFPAAQGFFVNDMALAPDGRLWCAGSFAGQADLPQGQFAAGGAFDGFVMSTADPVPVQQELAAPTWRVFPNPAADFIVIENFTPGERLRAFSASGLEVLGFERFGNVINIAAWPPGLYYLEVTGDETRSLLPFVKMRR